MNPSGDPPRRHLLRQEEQDEPTPRLEEPMELQSSSDSSSGAQRRAALRFTGANGTTESQSSSSAATMQTTNSSSSGSSAAFAAAAISNSRRHRHLIFTCQGITTGGGSSTASSSTDETEARERCFGSIDMQPLTGSSAVAAAAAGRHSTISLFNPVTRHRQYASLVCQSQGADRLVLESGHPSMSGPGSVGGEDSVDGTKHPLQSSSQPKDGSTSSSSAVQQDTLAYLPPQILRQVLLADFGIFCPVHSRSLALRYNQYTRWRRRYPFGQPCPFTAPPFLPRLHRAPHLIGNQPEEVRFGSTGGSLGGGGRGTLLLLHHHQQQQQEDLPFLLAGTGGSHLSDHLRPSSAAVPLSGPHNVGPYKMEKLLGRGNFAVVKLATHTQIKAKVAVKIINKELLGPQNLAKVSRELESMKRCHHPHIIRLYHVMETASNIFMVMEYASRGEVFDHISLSHAFTEKEARELFWQVVCAIDYCHKSGIVHRDLKAENLLIDADFKIKVADFGFSNFFHAEQLLTTHCGSPQYAAPELFKGEPYDGPLVDVWSLGVILYILVCGSFPFPGESLGDIRSQVLRGLVRFPFFLSTACEQVIRGMLQVDPARRFRLSQVTATSWMQASPNVLHYTQMMARFEEEVRKQRLDAAFQKQFPEHSSLMSENRTKQEMRHLDRGIIRALSLTTNANENELCLSICMRKYDRLHASYEILSDKINRFIKTPALREAVDQAILEATESMTNPPSLQRQASQHSLSEGTPSPPPPPSPPLPPSHLSQSTVLGAPSTVSPSTTPVPGISDGARGASKGNPLPVTDFRPPAPTCSAGTQRIESKLSIWREEEEEEEDEEDEQEDEELQRQQQESTTATVSAVITGRQGVEGLASEEVEADDIFLTSAVGNLAILGSGKAADLAATASSPQEKRKMDADSMSAPEASLHLRQDWAADYHAKKMDVRIALAILQADENEILDVMTDQIPQTTKHLRRHTIQLPSPTIGRRRVDMSHTSVSECESALEEVRHVGSGAGPSTAAVPAVTRKNQERESVIKEIADAPDGDTKGAKMRRRSVIRIPRQITQPEFGSWRGLQREVTTGPSVDLVSDEDKDRWLSSVWPRQNARLGGRGSDVFLDIGDNKELSLDLGQEASNTRPPSELLLASLSCSVAKAEEVLPGEPQPTVEKHREEQNLGPSIPLPQETQPQSSSLEGNQFQEQNAVVGELGQFFEETTEDGWENMPHYVGGDLLPQLNLPACLPSMIHQPVARFTVKDPNLLAPPEFMTPHSSSFPRRSSDGAADIATLHRPYPIVGGSFPEQANYRSEHKAISSAAEESGQKVDENGLSTAAWLQWSTEAGGAQAPMANPLPFGAAAAAVATARRLDPQQPTPLMHAFAESCETLGGGEGPKTSPTTPEAQTTAMDTVDVAAGPVEWSAFGSSSNQFAPVFNTQKRFSLPARQPTPLIEEATARAKLHEPRTGIQCCCEELVSSFLAQYPNRVTVEDVKNFKALLHSSLNDTTLTSCLLVPPSVEEGDLGPLFTAVSAEGTAGSSDWLRSSSDTATNAFAGTPRRGSEATQLRAWNQRLSQLYGTGVTLDQSRFPEWLGYETKEQLEALAQVKKQELQSAEGAVVGHSISPKASVSQDADLTDPVTYRKSPKRSTVCRVDSQHSLAYSGPSNDVLAEAPVLPRIETSEHFSKAMENPPRRETQIDGGTIVGSRSLKSGPSGVSGVFRGHSSWNEKRNIGIRHPLQRSKSQASWTDMQQEGVGTAGHLSVMAKGIPPPSADELSSPVGLPAFHASLNLESDTSLDREDPAVKGPSKRSPSAGSAIGGRRRQHTDPLRTVQHISASGSTERKLNFDFLTSPRRKLYHEWIPKMTAFSKRAAEALTDTRPAARISSLVQDLSPRLVGRASEGPVVTETADKVSSHNASSMQSSLAQPPEETINLSTNTSAEEETSHKAPTGVSDLGHYEAAVQSPEFSPQALAQEAAEPFFGFPYASHLRFFPAAGSAYGPLGSATGSPVAPLLPPYTCGSKLQLRFNDDDEDLAVIEQVNRRLALGQLETNPPWAGPPYLSARSQVAATDLPAQLEQAPDGGPKSIGLPTLMVGDVCLQPGPGVTPCFFPGAFPLDLTSRTAFRSEGPVQLSPPAEEALSEIFLKQRKNYNHFGVNPSSLGNLAQSFGSDTATLSVAEIEARRHRLGPDYHVYLLTESLARSETMRDCNRCDIILWPI